MEVNEWEQATLNKIRGYLKQCPEGRSSSKDLGKFLIGERCRACFCSGSGTHQQDVYKQNYDRPPPHPQGYMNYDYYNCNYYYPYEYYNEENNGKYKDCCYYPRNRNFRVEYYSDRPHHQQQQQQSQQPLKKHYSSSQKYPHNPKSNVHNPHSNVNNNKNIHNRQKEQQQKGCGRSYFEHIKEKDGSLKAFIERFSDLPWLCILPRTWKNRSRSNKTNVFYVKLVKPHDCPPPSRLCIPNKSHIENDHSDHDHIHSIHNNQHHQHDEDQQLIDCSVASDSTDMIYNQQESKQKKFLENSNHELDLSWNKVKIDNEQDNVSLIDTTLSDASIPKTCTTLCTTSNRYTSSMEDYQNSTMQDNHPSNISEVSDSSSATVLSTMHSYFRYQARQQSINEDEVILKSTHIEKYMDSLIDDSTGDVDDCRSLLDSTKREFGALRTFFEQHPDMYNICYFENSSHYGVSMKVDNDF